MKYSEERIEFIFKVAERYALAIPYQDNMLTPYMFHSGNYGVGKDMKPIVVGEDDYEAFVKERVELITESCWKSDNPISSLFGYILKQYRIPFLDLIKDKIDVEDFSKILAWIWVQDEYPHQNGIPRLINMFNRANKFDLMTEGEMEGYVALPIEFVVYRGTQLGRAKVRGLSWTLDYEKAKWFADRFSGGGSVYKARIKKSAVYALFTGRGEEEVVLNPRKLLEVNVVYKGKKKKEDGNESV